MFVRFNLPKLEGESEPIKGIPPIRASDGSVGFDLHIIREKEFVNGVHYFHTGWTVRAPEGYYPVIHPRSSLPKYGFTLANSTGIIDLDYQGELIVALVSRNGEPVPQLPFKAVQVVFDRVPYMGEMKYLDSIEEAKTKRGDGGFGSTDAN